MNAYIGIIISLVVFEIGVFLFKKSKNFFLLYAFICRNGFGGYRLKSNRY